MITLASELKHIPPSSELKFGTVSSDSCSEIYKKLQLLAGYDGPYDGRSLRFCERMERPSN